MGFFDEMDNMRMRPFHRKMEILASMGMFLDGYDLSVIAMAILLMPIQLKFSKPEYILVNVSALAGMIVGAPLLGRLSDRIGRKKIFDIDLILFVVFAITAGLATNFWMMFISRFMLGVGIGGDYPISSTIVSEFAPVKRRGTLLYAMVGMYWLGSLFSGIMNYTFAFTYYFWRYTFIIGGIVAIPIISLRMQIPESPRWLVSQGRADEASKVIENITGKEPDLNEGVIEGKEERSVRFRDLFSSGFLSKTVFVLSVWFLFDVASYGIGFYYPTMMREIGLSASALNTAGLRVIAEIGMIVAVGAIVGYAVAMMLADRVGRRVLTLVGVFVMFALLFLGSMVKIVSLIPLVSFFFSFVLFEQWVGAATLFYPTELYPTNYRSTIQGIATSVSRVGAIMGVVVFPLYPIFHSMFLFATLMFVAFVITVLFAPETKKKPLEKIWNAKA
ncbi:inorganic phosphate transporter related protein [Thermoplasma acidophilum]|uniref:Inorganic phosphate transporter related protein n=2 Tax=Thermoplasma acidophilum TaxID=2303 RepID=Q9HL96_THEAC|nr:inorganic phosphate transporter related protein [Thermoplasma acidophilum]